MLAKEIRIYARTDAKSRNLPANEPRLESVAYPASWSWNILGQVVGPAIRESENHEWYWFTAYGPTENADNVPPEFEDAKNQKRFVQLRIKFCDEEAFESFLADLEERVTQFHFCQGPWEDYDHVNDLGSERYIARGHTQEQVDERAGRIAKFMCATCDLFLDAFTVENCGAEQTYVPERTNHQDNPCRSFLESVHHLFCNATQVPLHAFRLRKGTKKTVAGWTYLGHAINDGWRLLECRQIRF